MVLTLLKRALPLTDNPDNRIRHRRRATGLRHRLLIAAVVCGLVLPGIRCLTPASAQDSLPEQREPREQYVPSAEFEAVFRNDGRGVLLPRERFEELLEQADRNLKERDLAPLPIVIEHVELDVARGEQQAVVTAVLTIRQFDDGWQVLRIPSGHLNLERAELADGSPALMGRDSRDPAVLQFAHPTAGAITLTLTLSTEVAAIGSDRVIAFRVPDAASAALRVSCPAGQQLLLNDLMLGRPAAAEEVAEYQVPVGGLNEIRLRWTDLRQQTESRTLVFVRTDAALRVQQESLRWSGDSRVSVYGGSINQIVARVPSQLEITSVESSGLESWVLEDDPDVAGRTRVTLTFRQPFTNDRVIRLTGVASVKDDRWQTVPALEYVDVTNHAGRVAVAHEAGLRLTADSGSGIRQVGSDELQGNAAGMSVFDFWLQQFDLRVAVRPRDRELFSEVNSELWINDSLAESHVTLTVETLNAPLFELPLRLPAEWHLTEVTAEGTAIDWRSGGEPTRIVVVPATPVPQDGLLKLTIRLQRTLADPEQEQRFALPFTEAEQTTVVGGLYVIRSVADLSVSPISVTGLTPVTGTGSQLVYRRQGAAPAGELSVTRRTPQLASRSELRTWSDARQLTVSAAVTVDVSNGTTRSLTVELPEELGDDVRFQVTGTTPVPGIDARLFTGPTSIAEQTPLDPVDGMRPFVLKLRSRFSGSLTLRAFVQRSVTDEPSLSAPVVRVRDAVRQHGVLVFEAYPEQQLEPSVPVAELDGVFEADPAVVEMPDAGTGRRIALTYRFVKPEYDFSVSRTRYATEAVPSAVCESLSTECVLNDAGNLQQSCAATFRLSGVQTLRFSLPDSEQAFLWSTILNSEPVEVRRDGPDYLVAVPRLTDDQPLELQILFESASARPDAFGYREHRPVRFSIDAGDQGPAPVEVLQQTWVMRYPESAALVENGGSFHAVDGTDQPGWIRRVLEGELPTVDQIGTRLVPVALIGAVLFVATALMHRRRWKTIASLLVLGFVLTILLLPATQQAREAARRGGVDLAFEQTAEPPGAVEWESPADSARSTAGMEPNFDGQAAVERLKSLADDEAEAGKQVRRAEPGRPAAGLGAFGGGGSGRVAGLGGGRGAGNAQGVRSDSGGVSDPFGMSDTRVADPFEGAQPPPSAPPATQPEAAAAASNAAVAGRQAEPTPGIRTAQPAVSRGRAGKARLSVRVDLQPPPSYQARRFLSVGDVTAEPGVLSVVIQDQERIAAMRLAAALVTLLCCWFLRSAGFVIRLTGVTLLVAAAAAAIPLAANRWQGLLDGVLLGAATGLLLWLVAAIGAGCRWLGRSVRSGGALRFRRPAAGRTAAAVLILAAAPTLHAQEAPTESLRPDVVIPYGPDQQPLQAGQVFISHDKFLELFRAAHPDALPDGHHSPLGNAVIAGYLQSERLRPVSGDRSVLRLRARYVIACDSETPVQIPVPLGPVGLASATLDDRPAALQPRIGNPANSNGDAATRAAQQQQAQQAERNQRVMPPVRQPELTVLVSGTGLHVLSLEFDVPATVAGESGEVELPLFPITAGRLEFTVPAADAAVRINGRTTGFRRDGDMITLPVTTAGPTRIQWQPDTRRDVGDRIVHSVVSTAVSVTGSGASVRSQAAITVRQGEIREAELEIPSGYAIQEVTGADVAGWSVPDEEPRRLRLQLRRPVTDATSVTITLFRDLRIEDERMLLEMPVLLVRGATRDTGTITLLAGDQFQVRSDALSGVTQINPQDAPVPDGEELPGRRVLAWRYTRHPASAAVRISRTAEQLIVRDLHAVQREEQQQVWTSHFHVRIAGAARSRIDIAIPEAFLVLDVSAHGMTDWYVAEGDDPADSQKVISLQLAAAREGTLDITVHGQVDRDPDASAMTLQVPEVRGATQRAGQLAVWLDAASENAGVDPGGWTVQPVQTLDQRFRGLSERPADVAFTTTATAPDVARIQLRRAVPSLLAESVTVSTATDTSVETTLALSWQVTRAATDTFVVDLPDATASGMTFDVPNHRRTRREDRGDGTTRVTFELQQPVSDRLFVLGVNSSQLPEDGQIRPQAPVFADGDQAAAAIAGQSHFWVLVNQSGGLLEPIADPEAQAVTTAQLSTSIPQTFLDQHVAIQRLVPDTAAWRISFPVQHQVTPAVVTLASHDTVIAEDGSWRSRHVLDVRNESRQFLPVRFPDGARLLACHVAGRPTRVVRDPERERDWYLIPIPQSGLSAAAFRVEFTIAGRFDASTADIREEWQSRRLQIPVPVFPEFREDEELGISVSRNRWSVWVPDSWRTHIVDDPRLTNVEPAEEDVLEDVSLRSVIEQTSSMMSAAQSAKGQYIRGKVARELQTQRDRLNRLMGNDAGVESERQDVLSRLGRLSEQIQAEEQHAPELDSLGQSAGTNLFLMEQDLNQNYFNSLGNTEFLRSNRAGGDLGQQVDEARDREAAPETGPTADPAGERFRFVLPESEAEPESLNEKEEAAERSLRLRDKAAAAAEGEPQADADQAPAQRSQLLQRQRYGRKAAPEEEFRPRTLGETLAAPAGDDLPMLGAAVAQSGQQGGGQTALGDMFADSANRDPAVAAEAAATGTLSLDFRIPTDGQRLDFVRTGGNASLSLDARAAESVSLGLGLLWAVACGVASVMIVTTALRRSALALVQLLLLMATIGSVAGWLLLAAPANNLFLLLAILFGTGCCVTFLTRSFRGPSQEESAVAA